MVLAWLLLWCISVAWAQDNDPIDPANTFVNPPPAGPKLAKSPSVVNSNPVYEIGSTIDVSWTTNLGSSNVALWQERSDSVTWRVTTCSSSQREASFTFDMVNLDISISQIFFFCIYDCTKDGKICEYFSHYFNLTAPVAMSAATANQATDLAAVSASAYTASLASASASSLSSLAAASASSESSVASASASSESSVAAASAASESSVAEASAATTTPLQSFTGPVSIPSSSSITSITSTLIPTTPSTRKDIKTTITSTVSSSSSTSTSISTNQSSTETVENAGVLPTTDAGILGIAPTVSTVNRTSTVSSATAVSNTQKDNDNNRSSTKSKGVTLQVVGASLGGCVALIVLGGGFYYWRKLRVESAARRKTQDMRKFFKNMWGDVSELPSEEKPCELPWDNNAPKVYELGSAEESRRSWDVFKVLRRSGVA